MHIAAMLLADGAWFMIVGLAIGIAAALGLTRFMSSLLFETGANDPAAFGLALAVLAVVGLVAAHIPARRASRLDPMHALRVE